MLWFLLWIVLFTGAGAVFFLLGRRLWRQAKELSAELSTASDRLAEVSTALSGLVEQQAGPDESPRPEDPGGRRIGSSAQPTRGRHG
ncbi:MAG: hypothetical protein ACRDV1_06890 [Actinomycetes bacterium]